MKITIEIEKNDFDGAIKFIEHILSCSDDITEETETYEFTNPVFENYQDAWAIRENMDTYMREHGYVTVSDLKNMSAPYQHTTYMSYRPRKDDYDYGWFKPFIKSIKQFLILRHKSGGWFIDFPKPKNVLHAFGRDLEEG